MSVKNRSMAVLRAARLGLATIALLQFSLFGPLAGSTAAHDKGNDDDKGKTRTPIKHVIVIVGENRTFDHIFATYKPKDGESVNNLLSEQIVKEDGSPGKDFSKAYQYSADVTGTTTFQLSPTTKKALYTYLPAPLNGGPTNPCTAPPSGYDPMCTPGDATSSENGLATDYYQYLLTGGTGLTGKVPDTRITGVHGSAPYSTLPPGPFQLTNSTAKDVTFPYDSYAASPVHRFYQMFQQLDCNAQYGTKENPDGCKSDLFTWTEVTVGSNNNGKPQSPNFSTDYAPPPTVTTGEGATAMGFYNMLQGDAPYTKELADKYAMSDNYHQPVKGGTGFDEIMLFFGDAIWFSDENGNPLVPPNNQTVWAGGPVDEIENPNVVSGTNNFWMQDGYGGFGNLGSSKGVYGGGSYSNCSDPTQPGVGPVLEYLSSLKPPIKPNCDPEHYYLLNNYNPGYFGDGSDAYTDHNPDNTPFTIPGTTQHSIGDVLLEGNVSWKGYNDQWNQYAGLHGYPGDPYQLHYGTVGPNSDQYCNICNGFHYQKQIMTNAAIRTQHLVDTTELYTDIENGTLPEVSFVKPSGWVDGHPASSKWNLFEGFVKKIVDAVKANPELWKSTAIFVTTDEGGGYYDSGYVQTLDFFGDGTRIPLIVVSPCTKRGHISHTYSDHVSVLKFIERNWNLPTISGRSRDNLPNPKSDWDNPYVPKNRPAISDLFDLFEFDHCDCDDR
jgi:phospholipase C